MKTKRKSWYSYLVDVFVLLVVIFAVVNILDQYGKSPILNSFQKHGIGILIKDKNDNKLLIDYNKDRDSRKLLINGELDGQINRLINKIVREGQKAICIGCNTGFYPLQISKLVGEKGHIFCFSELRKINSQFLLYSLLINDRKNLTLYQKNEASYQEVSSFSQQLKKINKNSLETKNVLEKKVHDNSQILSLKEFIHPNEQISVFLIQNENEHVLETVKKAENLMKNSEDLLLIQKWNNKIHQNNKEKIKNYVKFLNGFDYKITRIHKSKIEELTISDLLTTQKNADFYIIITKKIQMLKRIYE